MAEVKMFEVRDHATCMPVMAIRLGYINSRERWLWKRAGWEDRNEALHEHVYISKISDSSMDFRQIWGDRTHQTIVDYVRRNREDLCSGELLDVRVILGETETPCKTEMYNE